ncbi:putative oxidoreductase [Zhongshania aliphaticivorans]|uniref:Putative oxidoreductase n=1 Tax=Zhongshania aliphaticivorans TaxID=1470434 RepID=A0A5S9NAB9_9GAMM|nr:SDR family oxidoreductase [Zhongshania aliphaticivorans]CAA0079214.1 putative oxidoreductase [Zhongshania aliphaticivorans]CAA0086246.1 putative oxidoreductase [Zhongshania aliphaticivorans]
MTDTPNMTPVAVIIGAGDATGGAIARRFAEGGYSVVATRRNAESLMPLVDAITSEGGVAYARGCDARNEEEMVDLFDNIEQDIGPVEVVIFNIGANVFFPIVETTTRVYRKVWEMAAFAGFITGREAAKAMLPRQKGTIIFTGATASLRGGSGFSAFAGAKFALRGLAQSMARELGPQGIHVAHSIIDGAIDTAFIRDNFPDKYATKAQSGILDPENIAEQYWQIHQQPKDCWTHEFDLRPWLETF